MRSRSWEKRLLASCLSAGIDSAVAGRIFMALYNGGGILLKAVEKIRVQSKSERNVWYFTLRLKNICEYLAYYSWTEKRFE
jgi:hypothetical protein